MNTSTSIREGLEDLRANMLHARLQDNLGRLALLAYCDARGWAKQAGVIAIVERCSELFNGHPHADRVEFLAKVDALIHSLEQLRVAPDFNAKFPPPHPIPNRLVSRSSSVVEPD